MGLDNVDRRDRTVTPLTGSIIVADGDGGRAEN